MTTLRGTNTSSPASSAFRSSYIKRSHWTQSLTRTGLCLWIVISWSFTEQRGSIPLQPELHICQITIRMFFQPFIALLYPTPHRPDNTRLWRLISIFPSFTRIYQKSQESPKQWYQAPQVKVKWWKSKMSTLETTKLISADQHFLLSLTFKRSVRLEIRLSCP